MAEIISEQTVFDHHLLIREATFSNGHETYTRLRVERPDASVVLVYNTESRRFILTQQFRYAISGKHPENLVELVAGKVDPGEEPRQTAIRECMEEIGYRIDPEKMETIGSCFVSPGYTSELFHLYYAQVVNSDRAMEGGGLREENEHITVLEMEREVFLQKVRRMEWTDAKTLLGGLWFISSGK